MTPRLTMLNLALVAVAGAAALPAAAQSQAPVAQTAPAAAAAATAAPEAAPASIPRWARVSFFANVASMTAADGSSSSFSEIVTNVSPRTRCSTRATGSSTDSMPDSAPTRRPTAGIPARPSMTHSSRSA